MNPYAKDFDPLQKCERSELLEVNRPEFIPENS